MILNDNSHRGHYRYCSIDIAVHFIISHTSYYSCTVYDCSCMVYDSSHTVYDISQMVYYSSCMVYDMVCL